MDREPTMTWTTSVEGRFARCELIIPNEWMIKTRQPRLSILLWILRISLDNAMNELEWS